MTDLFIQADEGPKIDVSALNPGDYIEPQSISDAYGLSMDTTAFVWKVLGLKEQIEEETADGDRPLLCRIQEHGIRVMTADEAIRYFKRRFSLCIDALARLAKKFILIPVDGLTTEERREHRDDANKMANLAQMVKRERERLRLTSEADEEPEQLPAAAE